MLCSCSCPCSSIHPSVFSSIACSQPPQRARTQTLTHAFSSSAKAGSRTSLHQNQSIDWIGPSAPSSHSTLPPWQADILFLSLSQTPSTRPSCRMYLLDVSTLCLSLTAVSIFLSPRRRRPHDRQHHTSQTALKRATSTTQSCSSATGWMWVFALYCPTY